MAPLLVKRFAGLDTYWAPPKDAAIVCTGSILEHLPYDWDGYVVGSGKLHAESQPACLGRSNVHVLALRGPLTAHGMPGDYALCDPGILADELVSVTTKRHNLGILPHWSDTRLATDPRFKEFDPLIIDPRGDPLEVILQIGECRRLVTSSLHGLVVADAFAMPRRFENTPRLDREGSLFKHLDHSAAISTPLKVGVMQEASRYAVDDCKSELYDAFRILGERVRGDA